MPIPEEQQRQIYTNINKLDYLNGTGMLSSSRKHLAKELFLIISSGGAGRKALVELKKMLERQVEPDEIKDQVMFLAIDSCHGEQDAIDATGTLSSDEILKIPYKEARAVINPETIGDATKEWVHPGLYNRTNTAGYFDGTGASAMRQCGRVLFGQSATQDALRNKLMKVQQKAAKLAERGVIDPKLKVFFLAGIAGGTGSGTIVDLAFLTRYYLNQILPTWNTKTTMSAYLFLPSACSSTPASMMGSSRGNKNAYACLKEINYFMTLKDRQEVFVMDYGVVGANNVEINENIFDFCALVEGVANGGVFFGDGASTARKITGLSIMNIICQDNAKTAAAQDFFLVDSFLSNQDMKTLPVIVANSDKLMPREADYIYSVIGYASCVVPVELLTVYAFKKVFDVVYNEFSKNSFANKEAAKQFLKACQLDFDSVAKVAKTISKNELVHTLDKKCEEYFKTFGPYFMVNLTKEAVDLIRTEPNDYMKKAQKKMGDFMADKQKWNAALQLYGYAAEYLLVQNTQLFEVYTYVIRALRDLLEDNGKILTDTQTYNTYFGQSFQWSPIDLTQGSNATKAVSQYLDDIMNPKETRRLAGAFVNDLYAQKDKWTDLAPQEQGGKLSFDAAASIREFITDHMNNIVNTTLESFIVKAYSGNKDAKVFTTDAQGNEVPTQETIDAARMILDKLIVSSNPLASTGNGFVLNNAYHNQYLTVPDNCPWLYQAIVDSGRILGDNIFKSSGRDSLVMSVVYSGIPAWALTWVPTAEESYEAGDGPKEVGVHIEQAENGRNWAELPNLYPEGLWTGKQRQLRSREAGISKDIREKMELAKEKGLVRRDPVDSNYYDLLVFDDNKSARKLAESIVLSNKKRYKAKDVYRLLENDGEGSFKKLEYVRFVMTDDSIKDEEKREEFTWDLASRVVRKNLTFKNELEHTLEVSKAVEERIALHNPTVVDDSQIVLFAGALKWEMISYNSKKKRWSVMIDDAEKALGGVLKDNLQRMCAHYFGFTEFIKLDSDILAEMQEKIDELMEKSEDEVLDQADGRADELKKSITKLMKAKKDTETPWPEDSPFASCANESPWPMATLDFEETCQSKGYDADTIRRFYKTLAQNL